MRFTSALAAILTLSLSVAPALGQTGGLSTIRDAEIERTLQRMGEPIFAAAGIQPDAVEIFIIQDNSLNAFVLGRNMAFHTGLLIKLEDPKELLGVIAHETGHIAGGHGARTYEAIRQAQGANLIGTILGVAAIAAGAGPAGAAIIAGGQSVAQRRFLQYSRGQESSADQAALSYMSYAGIDPTGMLETLRRLKAKELVSLTIRDPYLLSHPLSQDRIERLAQRVSQSPYRGTPVKPDIAYWHARMRAKLLGFLLPPVRVLRDVADDNTETALIARAVAYHRSPDPMRALQTINRLVAMRPDDAFYHELKGQILFEGGDARAALPSVQRAATLAPEEPLILAALGQVLLALGEPTADREALQALRSATRRDRFDGRAWRMLAQAETRLGNDMEAALAGAEYQLIRGVNEIAKRDATKVQELALVGSPQWIRAGDILADLERIEDESQ